MHELLSIPALALAILAGKGKAQKVINEQNISAAIRTTLASALGALLVGPALGYAYFIISHSRGPLHFRFVWDLFGITYIILGPSALIGGLIFGVLLSVARLKVRTLALQTILAGCLGFPSGYAGISLAHHLNDGYPLLPAPGVMSAYYLSAGKVGVVYGVMFVLLDFLRRHILVTMGH